MSHTVYAAKFEQTIIHQQLLRKMRRKIFWTDGRTDRGKTVYPPPPSGNGSGGIMNELNNSPRQLQAVLWRLYAYKIIYFLNKIVTLLTPSRK